MKNTEKRYMTMKEAMEYTGMGELTLLGILSDIDVILKDKERVIRHTRNGRHPF